MTEPARWSALNESEMEVLRAAVVECVHHSGGRYPSQDVRAALLSAAWSLTSDDPPQGEIKMPVFWTFDCESGVPAWKHPNAVVLLAANKRTAIVGRPQANGSPPRTWVHVDVAPLALLLRSAGWRVEGPK